MGTIALVLDHQEGHLIPSFPLARRLVERGHRVVYLTVADGHHGLGLAGDLATTSADELQRMIVQLDGDPAFRRNLEAMRERFREAERAEVGIQVIESALAGATAVSPASHRGAA